MKSLTVENMLTPKGRVAPNQFVIIESVDDYLCHYFQSYDTLIVKFVVLPEPKVYLDKNYWNLSKTTGKYRNKFLGETKAQTQKNIDSGVYELVDLNS